MKVQLFLSLAGRDSAIQCLDEKIFLTSVTDFQLFAEGWGLVVFLLQKNPNVLELPSAYIANNLLKNTPETKANTLRISETHKIFFCWRVRWKIFAITSVGLFCYQISSYFCVVGKGKSGCTNELACTTLLWFLTLLNSSILEGLLLRKGKLNWVLYTFRGTNSFICQLFFKLWGFSISCNCSQIFNKQKVCSLMK